MRISPRTFEEKWKPAALRENQGACPNQAWSHPDRPSAYVCAGIRLQEVERRVQCVTVVPAGDPGRGAISLTVMLKSLGGTVGAAAGFWESGSDPKSRNATLRT